METKMLLIIIIQVKSDEKEGASNIQLLLQSWTLLVAWKQRLSIKLLANTHLIQKEEISVFNVNIDIQMVYLCHTYFLGDKVLHKSVRTFLFLL